MQFHERGYVSDDPRIKEAAGYGINRPAEIPDEMDVLVVGTGPAAVAVIAQLSRFPSINVYAIEKREGRLMQGQADGIAARSVETFNAFGFASEIQDESYRNVEMNTWSPDPKNPQNIIRTGRVPDDAQGLSEWPHIYVNQSRVLDYFLRDAERAPGKVVPNYGIEFLDLEIDRSQEYPVAARIKYVAGPRAGEERVVRA